MHSISHTRHTCFVHRMKVRDLGDIIDDGITRRERRVALNGL